MNVTFEYINIALTVIRLIFITVGAYVVTKQLSIKGSELFVSFYIKRLFKKKEPDKNYKVTAKYISHKNYSIDIKEIN